MKNDLPTSTDVQTLKAIEKLTDKPGEVPGYGTLADVLGVSRTAARKRVLRLMDLGLISPRVVEIPPPWKITRKGREWL